MACNIESMKTQVQKSMWCVWEEASGLKMRHVWYSSNQKLIDIHLALESRGAKNIRFERTEETSWDNGGKHQALYVYTVAPDEASSNGYSAMGHRQ